MLFVGMLIVMAPLAVCIISYHWGREWSVDPLSVEASVRQVMLFYERMRRRQEELDAVEEAETLRPPPGERLSPEEIAEGWKLTRVDGCWIKTISIDKIDKLDAWDVDDNETVVHQMDPEYTSLLDFLSKLNEEDNMDPNERPTVRPPRFKD